MGTDGAKIYLPMTRTLCRRRLPFFLLQRETFG